MHSPEIAIPQPIRNQLHDALVVEGDLVRVVRAQRWEPIVERSGLYHVTCALPIPRQNDPETAELRLLEVYLRASDEDRASIVRIDGLTPVDD